MTPLEILVTSLAYLMAGDGEVSAEERAKLLAVLNKHVNRKEIMPAHMKQMVKTAFAMARKTPVEVFAGRISSELSPGQRLAVFTNLYDTALADGEVRGGEKAVLDVFQGAFDLETNHVRALQEVLRIKNDSTVFTNLGHPHNDPNFKFQVVFQRE